MRNKRSNLKFSCTQNNRQMKMNLGLKFVFLMGEIFIDNLSGFQ